MIDSTMERPDAVRSAVPTLVDNWSGDLVVRDGYAFHERPAAPSGEDALAAFFTHVDKDDLQFRFLTAVQKVGHSQLQALVNVAHQRPQNFLAIEPKPGDIIATAMLAAEHKLVNGGLAVAIRADFKRRGIS